MKRKWLRITSIGTIARKHRGIGYKYWPNWLKREYDWEDRCVSINSQKLIEGTCLCVTNRRGCNHLPFDGGSSLNNDTTPFFRNTTRMENQLNEKQTLWKLLHKLSQKIQVIQDECKETRDRANTMLFFFFLISGKYNGDFETTINLLINLRDPQECINVIVPPRHINEFSWWSLGECCMNSDIILRSLIAERSNRHFRNYKINP